MALNYPGERFRLQDITPSGTRDLYLALARRFYPELDPQPVTIALSRDYLGVAFLGTTVLRVLPVEGPTPYMGRIHVKNIGADVGSSYATFLEAPTGVQLNPLAWWGVAHYLDDDLRCLRQFDELLSAVDALGLEVGLVRHSGVSW